MNTRVLAISGLLAALAVGASACGNGTTTAAPSPTEIAATAFQTIAPTTTKPKAATGTGLTRDPNAFQYIVQAGDFLFGIARKHSVTAQSIATLNGWTDGVTHPLNPNDKIWIPGTGKPATAVPAGQAGGPKVTTTTLANKCKGSYKIVAGDIPSRVAKKFNVSEAALNAANAKTPGYKNFVAGITIVIPTGAPGC